MRLYRLLPVELGQVVLISKITSPWRQFSQSCGELRLPREDRLIRTSLWRGEHRRFAVRDVPLPPPILHHGRTAPAAVALPLTSGCKDTAANGRGMPHETAKVSHRSSTQLTRKKIFSERTTYAAVSLGVACSRDNFAGALAIVRSRTEDVTWELLARARVLRAPLRSASSPPADRREKPRLRSGLFC